MVGVVEDDEPAEDNLNHQLLPPMPVPAKPSKQAVSGVQIANELAQFQAVLQKNLLLKTRGRTCFGLLPVVVIEIVLPLVFFALMCLPKALVDPQSFPLQLSQPVPLNSRLWSNCLACNRGRPEAILRGTCTMDPQGYNTVLYTPAHSAPVETTVDWMAKVLSCTTTVALPESPSSPTTPPSPTPPYAPNSRHAPDPLDRFSNISAENGAMPWTLAEPATNATQKPPSPQGAAESQGSGEPLDASRDGEMASLLAMLSEQDAFREPAFAPVLGTFANSLLNGGHQAHCLRFPHCCGEALDANGTRSLTRAKSQLAGVIDQANRDARARRDNPKCYTEPECWMPFRAPFSATESEEAAVQQATSRPMSVTAVLVFDPTPKPGAPGISRQFTIRMNASDTPNPRFKLPLFVAAPDNTYKCGNPISDTANYWFFSNLQSTVQQAMLSEENCTRGAGEGDRSNCRPVIVDTWVKSFPWRAFDLDIGSILAGVILRMLLIFAFITPFQGCVKSIVTEKELRLREGMALLGLHGQAYWASWFLTHFSALALSSCLMAVVGTYPFQHTQAEVMLAFYLLLSAALVTFAYFISTLFDRARVAGTGALFIYLLALVPGYIMPVVQMYGGSGRLWSCLLPPSALTVWSEVLITLEAANMGITWDTIHKGITQDTPSFTAAQCMQMLAVDILLYSLLTWYFDNILPKEWGVVRPWYFPLQRSYWCPRRAMPALASQTSLNDISGHVAQSSLEVDAHRRGGAGKVAVRIRRLCKTYDTVGGPKQAVRNLDLDMYEGQITGFLGHNGAGKTTTIGMLTGLIAPTSGNVHIYGNSLDAGMGAIRQSLGLCPQYDILWPELTVREHLLMYARFKGLPADSISAEVECKVQDVGLGDKLDAQAGTLSGGQKRKLSVAIAFIGNPKVVILDEPTSGMDPYSRRFTWDVVRRNKQGRVVVLTTHFMDEADILCDRIAIVSQGQLACEGSPLELKSRYGLGYTLTLVNNGQLSRETFAQQLTGIVTSHVPDSKLLSNVGAELTLQLPRQASARFPSLLRNIEAQEAALGVRSYGISITSMEEVFLALLQEQHAREHGNDRGHGPRRSIDGQEAEGSQSAARTVESDAEPPLVLPPRRLATFWEQVGALVVKRAINSRRDRMAVLTQLVAPAAFVLLALSVSKATGSTPVIHSQDLTQDWAMNNHQVPVGGSIPLDVDLTRRTGRWDNSRCSSEWVADVRVDIKPVHGHWEPVVHSGCGQCDSLIHHVEVLGQLLVGNNASKAARAVAARRCPRACAVAGSMDDYLLRQWSVEPRLYGAVFFPPRAAPQPVNVSVDVPLLTVEALHLEPLTYLPQVPAKYNLTVMVNQSSYHALPAVLGMAHSALSQYEPFKVTTHSLPLLENEARTKDTQQLGQFLLTVCMSMAAAVLSAAFVVFLVKERYTKAKHVQMVSGVSIEAFWTATYLWDLANYLIPSIAIVTLFAAFNLPYYTGANLPAVALLFLLFGTASLPLTYCLHFLFMDEMSALTWMLAGFFTWAFLSVTTNLMLQVLSTVGVNGTTQALHVTQWLFRFVSPHYCLVKGLSDLQTNHNRVHGGATGMPPAGAQADEGAFALDVTGYHMLVMAGQAVVFLMALLATEHRVLHRARIWGRRLTQLLRWRREPALQSYNALQTQAEDERTSAGQWEDIDVQREREAVERLLTARTELVDMHREGAAETGLASTNVDMPLVVARQLVKVYPRASVAAVKGVSFMVPRGEVFGLLGVNGAGKTTAFGMLTGDHDPSLGEAFISGHSVVTDLQVARQHMGYCPQFDATQATMTGREHLHFYAKLRGIKDKAKRSEMVDSLLSRLGLIPYADRVVASYSGGNRRKLSVGIALVGDPACVLLDEPSTGMDPEARRSMWDIISSTMQTRAVVLTSHSMEECDALCARLTIMAGGRMRCVGSVQHLKSRFGGGYNLEFRMSPSQRTALQAFVVKELPEAQLMEASDMHLKFSIAQGVLHLSMIFEKVEAARQVVAIHDYGISQTSLEQVFVRFAQEQDLENSMPEAMREYMVNNEVLNPVTISNDSV